MLTDTGTNHTCPNFQFAEIKKVADTAWNIYNSLPNTGIGNVNNIQFNIYPNPAKTLLYIEGGIKNNFSGCIIMYDVAGRKLNITYKETQGKIELNISSLSPGMYVIKYVTETGVGIKQFVKE